VNRGKPVTAAPCQHEWDRAHRGALLSCMLCNVEWPGEPLPEVAASQLYAERDEKSGRPDTRRRRRRT
jgi:hypothetical protein